MSAVAFDTLKLARQSRDDVATKADLAPLATKVELAELKAELKADIGQMRAEIGRLEERIERRAAEADLRLMRWMLGGGAAAATLAILGAVWTALQRLPAVPIPHP